MPAKTPSINLYRRKELDSTALGRITEWAVTYGRYIMVGTEIIVLLAFISRFSLDRKLTDLREEVAQKQLILEANQAFEDRFKLLQAQLVNVKGLMDPQQEPEQILTLVHQLLPFDVYLNQFELNSEDLTIGAVAGSTEGFSQFLVNLQSTNRIGNIEVSELRKQPISGIRFKLVAKIIR